MTGTGSDSVIAVISAFEPDEGLLEVVQLAMKQTLAVIVVDDGSPSLRTSPDGCVHRVLDDCRAAGAVVIESSGNRGIAAALNQGVRRALDAGADVVLTLDQDTLLGSGFVSRTLDHLHLASSLGLRTGILSPSIFNGGMAPFWYAAEGLTLAFEPIQSGMVIPRAVFDEIGLFDEDLFIDCVDTEFYLRARSRGLHAFVVPGASIQHRLGRPAQWTPPRPLRWIMRGATIQFTEDAAFRHYYIARNRLSLYRKYWRAEPLWCASSIIKDSFARGRSILIGSTRRARLYLTAAGSFASLRGETGKIPPRTLKRARRLG